MSPSADSMTNGHDGHLVHHVVPVSVYLAVFAALLVLTGLTVAVAMWDLGAYNSLHTPLAMAIAAAKTLLVVLYFMHVRHSERLTWIFIASAVLFLFFLISLTLSDYVTRGRDATPSTWSANVSSPPSPATLPRFSSSAAGPSMPGRSGEALSSPITRPVESSPDEAVRN